MEAEQHPEDIEHPIIWGDFKQARFGDIEEGDLILTDAVYGVEHVTSVVPIVLAYGEKVMRIGLQSRSLAFPHLSGGSDERYTTRNIARFPMEPTLRVRVIDAEMSRRAHLAHAEQPVAAGVGG